jgi:large subunit ribosomal protein L24
VTVKVKKGDTVVVIAGKDKGAKGKVIAAYPRQDKVLVEGVNRVKKHTRIRTTQRGAKTGGIVTQEAPIHVSNVALLVEVEKDGKKQKVTTRVGYNRVEVQKRRPDGSTYTGYRSVRIARRTGEEI